MMFVVSEKDTGKRLDAFLTDALGQSRSKVQKMIKDGQILVNGKAPKKAGDQLKSGYEVQVLDPGTKATVAVATPEIEVIYEADDYLIIHKPAGLLVHPTEANESGTLADWVLQHYPALKGVGEYDNRPGIVHRLDKEASGVMVIAKTQAMFDHLKDQFQDRTVEKEYAVLVHGVIAADNDSIDFAIDRGSDGRMVSRPHMDKTKLKNVGKDQAGKASLTEFWVERRFARFTLLKVKIHTGRTHQIRVHMLAYGHPVVGDVLYVNKKLNRKRDEELGRLFLHAQKLCFTDLSGQKQCYEAHLPQKLLDFIADIH